MTPPRRTNHGPDSFDDTPPIITGDALARLGRVEYQVNQILPVLGKVAESVENLTQGMADIKVDLRNIGNSFNEFKVETSSYGLRIFSLEKESERVGAQRLDDLQVAKDKAVTIIEEAQKEECRQRIEKRNNILKIVGGAVGSITVAAILAWLGLK
jgi:hypothetical protein